jgi:hypothetical protein
MLNERSRRYGATLSAAAALGGIMMSSAKAHSYEGSSTDKQAVGDIQPSIPKGAHFSDHLSQQEIAEALKHLDKRWDGVLVLHAPKKNVYVGFTESPSYYVSENPDLYMTGNKSLGAVICPKPGIEKIHGRDYAISYDTATSNWAFLDIAYAQESGALSYYAFKNTKPQAVPYPLEEQQADMPVINDVVDYGANWIYGEDNRVEKLLSIWLPTNIDPDKKNYSLVPSNVIPHV